MSITYVKRIFSCIAICAIILSTVSGCRNNTGGPGEKSLKLTVLLDWVPNTNHTGVYVAKDKGYYEDEGLSVEIIQPSEGGSADLIAAGQGNFGFSYQEQVVYARTAQNPLPVVAIAAIIQHNTSGFASPADKGIKTARDFEGKKYGGWGSPAEEAAINALMNKEDADFGKVEMVNVGAADFFASVEENVDFSWIYYGWDGIAAEVKDYPINFIRLQDVVPELDFYTPVIIASESYLNENPDIARHFLRATKKGYEYCIDNPEDAVQSLLKDAPEIDADIAAASQKYLAGQYIADAPKWGEMKMEMWKTYADWMYDNGLLENKLDCEGAFTNEYLP
jgi:ABC-type nitrate/sulfonate/bicarbonate transport system substrate-binding protein